MDIHSQYRYTAKICTGLDHTPLGFYLRIDIPLRVILLFISGWIGSPLLPCLMQYMRRLQPPNQ